MIKYKLYGIDDGETFYVGKMKLDEYLWYLNYRRCFNEELTIQHTKKYYDIDLTEIIKDYSLFWTRTNNIYESFYKVNSIKEDKETREHFNTYARNKYLNFMEQSYLPEEDCLGVYYSYSDIHHIHPLMYGGQNNLENLIHLSEFHHDLLHQNPLEEHEKYCHWAVDYLGSLYCESSMSELIVKYNLVNYPFEMMADMLKVIYKQEMKNFYTELLNTHRTNAISHT